VNTLQQSPEEKLPTLRPQRRKPLSHTVNHIVCSINSSTNTFPIDLIVVLFLYYRAWTNNCPKESFEGFSFRKQLKVVMKVFIITSNFIFLKKSCKL
jgi:hypothetical protein